MKKKRIADIILIIGIVVILILILLPALQTPKNYTVCTFEPIRKNGSVEEVKQDFKNLCSWFEKQNFKVVKKEKSLTNQSIVYKGKFKNAEIKRVTVLLNLVDSDQKPYIEAFYVTEMEYKNHPDRSEFYLELKKHINQDNKREHGD